MKSYLTLLSLLWSLVEVHSQTEYPYVSFMGENLSNNSYVDLTLVGEDDGDPGNTVRCHTDLHTCCGLAQGGHRGDWYFPDGDRLEMSDIYVTNGSQRIILNRRNDANSPSGIFRCEIPTVAIQDDDDVLVRETVNVGLYASGGECCCAFLACEDMKLSQTNTDKPCRVWCKLVYFECLWRVTTF